MRDLRRLDEFRQEIQGHIGDSGRGFFIIPRKSFGFYQVMASNGQGWDHVSMCILDNKGKFIDRTPKWDEMCAVKQVFFKPDEAVIQIHPSEDIKVDDSNYTLELWQPKNLEMPLPDPILVGKVKKYPAKTDQK